MSLYCVTHKPVRLEGLNNLALIQVGKVPVQFPSIRDNQDDHIASQNDTFSELTAFYNIWKNHKSDFVGFCHYRRHFIPPELSDWATNTLSKPYKSMPVEATGEGNYASCFHADSS